MFAARIADDSWNDFLVIAIYKSHPALHVQLDQGQYVFLVNSAVRAFLLPGFAGVITVFIFLDPDAGLGEEVHAIGMVPMHMGDDYVGDVFRLDSGLGYGF